MTRTAEASVGRLPPELALDDAIGRGRRSTVYAARLLDRPVACKVYRQEYNPKYRRRCGQSIARFEFDRNAAFYRIDALRPLVAEPIAVYGDGDGYCSVFVQERVEGETVRDVARAAGGIPPETLAALTRIVEVAGKAGLYDIDLSPTNMKLRRTPQGWMPVLFDFNLIPQHQHAPNPWVTLLYWTGLRHPAHRDRLMLRKLHFWKG